MNYSIVGFEFRKGLFERDGKSFEYDNILIHCQKKIVDKGIGLKTEIFKISTKNFDEVGLKFEDLLGVDVKFMYNKYGHVESFVLA